MATPRGPALGRPVRQYCIDPGSMVLGTWVVEILRVLEVVGQFRSTELVKRQTTAPETTNHKPQAASEPPEVRLSRSSMQWHSLLSSRYRDDFSLKLLERHTEQR